MASIASDFPYSQARNKTMPQRHLLLFLSFLTMGLLFSIPLHTNATEPTHPTTEKNQPISTDKQLLDRVQKECIDYFWSGAESHSGMARERIHTDNIYPQSDQNVVTSGGSGFGLMALIVGIERGFIDRKPALAQFEKILSFLESADRFHGVWPHWWEGPT